MLRGRDSHYRCETTAVHLVAMETALGGCRRGRARVGGLILFLGGGSNEPRSGNCAKSLVWSFWEFSPFSVRWPLSIAQHCLGGKPFKERTETQRD